MIKSRPFLLFLLFICLTHFFWLTAIPGGKEDSLLLGFSSKRILLLCMTLLPVCIFGIISTRKLNEKLLKYEGIFKRITPFLSVVVIIFGCFFFLIPENTFRIQITTPAIWQRLLPVVSTYFWIAILLISFSIISENKAHMSKTGAEGREIFIDFTRGFAILLAILSHIFFTYGYGNIFGDAQFLIKAFTRFATPGFILITGMMFELVYFQRALKHGLIFSTRSLLKRSLSCYLAYLISVFIAWFNQVITTQRAFKAIFFLDGSPYSDILKYYSILLILAILLIRLRLIFGIKAIAILPLLVWLINIPLNKIAWSSIDSSLSNLTSLLFGKPAISPFSIFHSITFISLGMVLGFYLRLARQKGNWRSFIMALISFIVLGSIVSLLAVFPKSLVRILYLFANDYRTNHDLAYYSIGGTGALLILGLFWTIRGQLSSKWLNSTIVLLGRDSLWAFTVGNSLILLLPHNDNRPIGVILFSLALFLITIIVIQIKNRLKNIFQHPLQIHCLTS